MKARKFKEGHSNSCAVTEAFLKVPLHSQRIGNWAAPKRGE